MQDAVCGLNGGIDDAIGRVNKEISNISESLCQLESKLEPVLIPMNGPTNESSGSDKPPYSPIHCEIDGINRALRGVTGRIISMIEQADLTRNTVDRPKQAL